MVRGHVDSPLRHARGLHICRDHRAGAAVPHAIGGDRARSDQRKRSHNHSARRRHEASGAATTTAIGGQPGAGSPIEVHTSGSKVAAWASLFSGLVALTLGLAAYFGGLWRRPKLTVAFDEGPEGVVRAASGQRWVRLHVQNAKRSRTAEDVEVLATGLVDEHGESIAPLSGRSLGWTHFSSTEGFDPPRTRINIPPGVARPIDLLVYDAENGTEDDDAWPRLRLVPNPSHLDRYVLAEGKYVARFALTARDTPPSTVNITIAVGAGGKLQIVPSPG